MSNPIPNPVTVGQSIGIGAATKGIGMVTDMAGNALNTWLRYYFNEKAADNADERDRKQWKDMYSIGAQLRQLRENGLSPSMMFGGMPSQGGATGAQGNGASGPIFNSSPLDISQLAELEVAKSQAELNRAEAANLNKDTNKKDAEINEIFARIANLNQNTLNQKEQQRILQLDTTLKEIDVIFDSSTLQGEIDKVYNEADYMYHLSRKTYEDSRKSHLDANFNEQSFMLRLNQLDMSNFQILCDAAQKLSQVELNQAQVQSLMAHVGIDLYNAVINHGRLILEGDKLDAQINQWAKENEISSEQVEALKTGNWLRFAGTMFQSFSYVMGAGLNAAGNVISHAN